MSEQVSTTGTRNCDWCAETISFKALKCPKCNKWRKDIDQDRIKSYTWGGLAILPAGLLFVGMEEGWWHTKDAFLTSISGLLVLAGFVATGCLSFMYYSRVSKKIGSWWWV